MAKMSEQRKQLGRENYKLLHDAGFSVEDASRYKFSSRENVLKAIENKALPELQEKKRTRATIKPKVKKYKSSIASIVTIPNTDETYLKKVLKEFDRHYKKGFRYYSIRVTFSAERSYQTQMMLVKNVKTIDDFLDEITTEIEAFTSTYGFDEILELKIEIIFWKPNVA
jgi:hypothetical protein